jgi:hypothetical protein
MGAEQFHVTPIATRAALRCAVALAVIVISPLAVDAAFIPGGLDYFTTERAGIDPEPFLPGIGYVELEGFPYPGSPDPTALFPLPDIAEVQQALFQVTWFDEHGNQVTSDSEHKVKQVKRVRPGVDPFDTIVRRKADATVGSVGDEQQVPIEIEWLSLRSVDPIDIGLPVFVDLYVGLDDEATQIEGKMKLISESPDGNQGKVDIGKKGETPDDPLDPDFLGLPVVFQVVMIPVGQDPIPDNVVARQRGVHNVFHGKNQSPSGSYVFVPEPSTFLIWSLLAGLGIGLGWRRRK